MIRLRLRLSGVGGACDLSIGTDYGADWLPDRCYLLLPEVIEEERRAFNHHALTHSIDESVWLIPRIRRVQRINNPSPVDREPCSPGHETRSPKLNGCHLRGYATSPAIAVKIKENKCRFFSICA